MERGNLFEGIPTELSEEMTEVLASGGGGPVRVERIVSMGQASPEGFWYDQAEEEWVVVVKGEAVLRVAAAGEGKEDADSADDRANGEGRMVKGEGGRQEEGSSIGRLSGSSVGERRDEEDGTVLVEMKAGDWVMIPAGCRHRVEGTSAEGETVWVAVFFGGGGDNTHAPSSK